MNLNDEDEYTRAFNAATEDAPEGDSGAEASAVTLGAEEAPEEAPVEMAEELPADVPTQEAPAEEKPVDWEQKYKTLEGKYKAEVPALAEKVRELESREAPQTLADGGKAEDDTTVIAEGGNGGEFETVDALADGGEVGDDIESIKQEALNLAGNPDKLAQVLATMIADYGREFVVGAVALAGPLIDAKAESYASDFNGNLDGLISEIQGAFSSMHKQTIADAHEDFEDLVESPEFQAFRDSLPEDQQAKADATIESGSAGAVIKLLQAFKDAKDKPKEKTLEDAWAEDAATSVRSSSPLKVSSRAPMSEDDEYKAAFEAA